MDEAEVSLDDRPPSQPMFPARRAELAAATQGRTRQSRSPRAVSQGCPRKTRPAVFWAHAPSVTNCCSSLAKSRHAHPCLCSTRPPAPRLSCVPHPGPSNRLCPGQRAPLCPQELTEVFPEESFFRVQFVKGCYQTAGTGPLT